MKHDPIIRQIVARCHVSETPRAVARYVISRLARGYETWRSTPRARRCAALRQIFTDHAANRRTYAQVMKGARP